MGPIPLQLFVFFLLCDNNINRPILWFGGPVMSNTITVHFIWYGTAFTTGADTVLDLFMANINSSVWWNIARQYCPFGSCPCSSVGHVGDIKMGSHAQLDYIYGTSISEDDIGTMVLDQITNHNLGGGTVDEIYFVLTDQNVTVSGQIGTFCVDYCGWHSAEYLNEMVIKYGFIGSPLHCHWACSALPPLDDASAPNSNYEMDSMISVIAHELAEAATDPNLTAWFTIMTHSEAADLCEWLFTGETTSPPYWNQNWTGHHFLVQDLWALWGASTTGTQGCLAGMPYPNLPSTGTCASLSQSLSHSHSHSHHFRGSGQSPTPKAGSSAANNTPLIVGVVVGLGGGLIVLGGIVAATWKHVQVGRRVIPTARVV